MFSGTPHNSAVLGDFGKTVLMPGDPQRAEYIAKNFLTAPVLVNNVRGVQGYTGYYKGVKVSVMASGMGMPSIGVYSHELYKYYGVENIIRVGSAGGLVENIKLHNLVIAQGACTDSNYLSQFNLPGAFAPIADYNLLNIASGIAKERQIHFRVGNVLSSDMFYNNDPKAAYKWQKLGVLAVEMETAALYANAALFGRRALTICTVSDIVFTQEKTSIEDRVSAFNEMIDVALETAVQAENL